MITKIFGLLIISTTLAVTYLFESTFGQETQFRILHWPAILLTSVGPIGLVLLSSDRWMIREVFSLLFGHSPNRQQRANIKESNMFRQLIRDYYQLGYRAFDNTDKSELSPTAQRVIEKLALRIPIRDVLHLCERESDQWQNKVVQAIGTVSLGVKLCPSVGMLGTILGMTQLLAHIKDPSLIGSNMSLALLTTFYGLFFSLVIWTPIQNHLIRVRDTRNESFDQIFHWLELMEHRKPAQYLAEEDVNVETEKNSGVTSRQSYSQAVEA